MTVKFDYDLRDFFLEINFVLITRIQNIHEYHHVILIESLNHRDYDWKLKVISISLMLSQTYDVS